VNAGTGCVTLHTTLLLQLLLLLAVESTLGPPLRALTDDSKPLIYLQAFRTAPCGLWQHTQAGSDSVEAVLACVKLPGSTAARTAPLTRPP
jgi:hypothetical protein